MHQTAPTSNSLHSVDIILAPISVLPPELLSIIFNYISTRPSVDETPTRDPSTAFKIWDPTVLDASVSLVLVQVCRHWRDVCMQSSALWSHVVDCLVSTIPPPEVAIERSRGQPLKVLFTSPKPRLADTLAEHSHRIQELHWISLDLQRDIPYLSFPAPSLRTLTLTGPRTPTSYDYPDSPPDHDHLPTLFNNHTPRLSRLSLSNLTWLPHTSLGSLTHLYLDSSRAPHLFACLLALLSGTPRLEHLVLSALPELAPEHSPTTTAPVALNALRTLVLKSLSADSSAALLGRLALPASTALRIADTFPCTVSLPTALAPLAPVRAATRLALDLTRARPSVCAVGDAAGVRVDEYTSWYHYQFWLEMAHMAVSQARIKELWVRASAGVDAKHAGALCTLLRALPQLELLVVDDAVVELMRSMRGCTAFPECPSLTSVHVLCEGRLEASAIVEVLLANETQLAGKHVRVCCMPGFPFVPDEWKALDGHFHSIEYLACECTPAMAMPDICSNPGHILWPSWRSEVWG